MLQFAYHRLTCGMICNIRS